MLISSCFYTSCSDTPPKDLTPITKKVEQIDQAQPEKVSSLNPYAKMFFESEEFGLVKGSLGQIKIEDIEMVKYPDNITGLIIKVNPIKGIKRDIMVIINGNTIIPFIRLNNISSVSNGNAITNSGKVKWYTAYGEDLNEMEFINNQVTNFKLTDVAARHAAASSRTTTGGPSIQCKWVCSEATFNKLYKLEKKNCEDSWQCDLLCSFQPCALNHVFNAARHCWRCVLGAQTQGGTELPQFTPIDIDSFNLTFVPN